MILLRSFVPFQGIGIAAGVGGRGEFELLRLCFRGIC